MISNKVNLRADARFKPIKGGCVWIFRFAILAMFEIGRFWVFRGFRIWFLVFVQNTSGFPPFQLQIRCSFRFFSIWVPVSLRSQCLHLAKVVPVSFLYAIACWTNLLVTRD